MTNIPAMRVDARVRFLALAMGVVFVVGWVSWFGPFDDLLDRQGTPLGGDFAMFYSAGRTVAEGHPEHLYDQAFQQQQLQRLFPGLAPQFCLPFRYPPHVAVLLAPLACLPYPLAWFLFTAGSVASWVVAWRGLRASTTEGLNEPSPRWIQTAGIALAGWPVVWETIAGGQASLYALAIVVATAECLKNRRPIAAGACLALACYKPNVLLLFGLGLVCRQPRVLLGAIPVGLGLLGLGFGLDSERFTEYFQLSSQLAAGPWDVATPFWKVHGLAPALEILVPGRGRLIGTALGAILAAAVAFWWRHNDARSPAVTPLALALLLVVNSLLNPYCPIYDLMLLGAAGWWGLAAYRQLGIIDRGGFSAVEAQTLFAILFFGPHLSQALARPLGCQLFPWLLLAATTWVLARAWCSCQKTVVQPI